MREAEKQKARDRSKKWREDNRERSRMYANRYARQNPATAREWTWKDQGIEFTYEEYEALLVKQEYRCGICKTHTSELPKSLAVDHDHETGEIRGLLCMNCNLGIGKLRDSIDLLKSAIEWLSK